MRGRPLGTVCLGIIFFLFLASRRVPDPPDTYEAAEGKQITVIGQVYQKEKAGQEKGGGVLYLQLTAARSEEGEIPVSGKRAVCYLRAGQTLPETGSIIKAEGKLKCFQKSSNPGQFDGESYYRILELSFQLTQTEIQKITKEYQTGKEMLFRLKEALGRMLFQTLPKQEAAIMQTMLLGEKASLEEEIKGLYQRNGIAHVLAISGLHISMVGMLFFRLLRRLGVPMGLAAVFGAGVIFLYGGLTGFSVSATRAVIMFGFHMAALFAGRTYDLITAALLAAVMILLEQPLYFYHSGFLFSFGCVFAIGFFVPVMTAEADGSEQEKKRVVPNKAVPNAAVQALAGGAVITLTVLPIQLWFFYQTPVYAVFLNLLVIPLMSFLLPGGMLLVAVNGMGSLLARFLGMSGWVWAIRFTRQGIAVFVTGVLRVYEKACRFCEALPLHLLTTGRPQLFQIIIFYGVLFCISLFRKKLSLLKRWVLLLGAVLLLFFPVRKGEGELQITFLDVGQGDCIHIQGIQGEHYLVDGGSASTGEVGKYRILPYLKYQGVKELEGIFVTHPDADHSNGIMELLAMGRQQGLQIKKLYLPAVGEGAKGEGYLALKEAAEKAGVEVREIGTGWQAREGTGKDSVSFLCLHPSYGYESREANEYSTVLLVKYGAFSTLLTGDVEGEGETLLTENLVRAGVEKLTVLKVAHHGSSGSTSEDFLSVLTPSYAVISYGKNNPYGHPHKETLERLTGCGAVILDTQKSGAITIRTDGKKLRIEEFCNKKPDKQTNERKTNTMEKNHKK